MKLQLSKYVTEEKEVTFSRWMKVPKWMFDYDFCSKCQIEFDDDQFEDDWVI